MELRANYMIFVFYFEKLCNLLHLLILPLVTGSEAVAFLLCSLRAGRTSVHGHHHRRVHLRDLQRACRNHVNNSAAEYHRLRSKRASYHPDYTSRYIVEEK